MYPSSLARIDFCPFENQELSDEKVSGTFLLRAKALAIERLQPTADARPVPKPHRSGAGRGRDAVLGVATRILSPGQSKALWRSHDPDQRYYHP